jgi:hypothetical protein
MKAMGWRLSLGVLNHPRLACHRSYHQRSRRELAFAFAKIGRKESTASPTFVRRPRRPGFELPYNAL